MEWGDITCEDIKIQCPGDGIAPYYLDAIVGQKVAHTTGPDELVRWHDILSTNDAAFQEAVAHA